MFADPEMGCKCSIYWRFLRQRKTKRIRRVKERKRKKKLYERPSKDEGKPRSWPLKERFQDRK